MPRALSVLEKNILKSKGATEAQIKKIEKAGIHSKADFATVGNALTLSAITGIPAQVAQEVMTWALGAPGSLSSSVIKVDSVDLVNCTHCGTKQPKDYKSGDLCGACGKQAEPVSTCFWCAASGPGTFCRQCGAEYVPTGELELAVLLKREGISKSDITPKLRSLDEKEKNVLWGRVRRNRG